VNVICTHINLNHIMLLRICSVSSRRDSNVVYMEGEQSVRATKFGMNVFSYKSKFTKSHWINDITLLSPAFSKKKGGYRNWLRPSVRPSVRQSHILVRSITLSFIKGIWNNLAQMFVIIRRCVMRNNKTPTSRVKVALAHLRSILSIWGYMS
jgi:hypothetical protein